MTVPAETLRLLGHVAEQLWLPAVLAAAWWAVSAGSTSVYFPPLQRILATLWDGLRGGPLLDHLLVSLQNLAAGLAVAIAIGVTAGLLLGERELLRRVIYPVLHFARTVPPAAVIPLVVIALGIGPAAKVYVIAFGCTRPVLLNTIDGVRGVSASVRDTARAYRLPARLRLRRVLLPGAMPQIVTGVRVALSLGVILVVVSELFGAEAGIGYYILSSGRRFAVDQTWAGTLLIGAVGYLLSTGILRLERLVLRWYFQSSA